MTAPRFVRFDAPLIREGVSLLPAPLPFKAAHAFLLENWSGGERERGNHAHRQQTQALCVIASRVFVLVEQRGGAADKFLLQSSDPAWLVVYPQSWLTLRMSPGARVLVIADGHHDEADYQRDRSAWEAGA